MKLQVALNPNCKNKQSPESTNTGWSNVECTLNYLMDWVGKGLAWSGTHFSGRYRSSDNSYGSNLIVIDVDGDVTLDRFHLSPLVQAYCLATYTSCSHNPNGEHRFRALFQMEDTLESSASHRAAYRTLTTKLCSELGIECFSDNSGSKPERLWYGNTEAAFWINPEHPDKLPLYFAEVTEEDADWSGQSNPPTDQELEQCRYLLQTRLIRPSDDGEYEYWSRITAACSSAGSTLFDAWQDWCTNTHHGSNSTQATHNCSATKYRSFTKGSWITLFAEAKAQHGSGWKQRILPSDLTRTVLTVDPLPDVGDLPSYMQATAQLENDNLEVLATAVQIPEDTEPTAEDDLQLEVNEDFAALMERLREGCHNRDGAGTRTSDFEALNLLMPGIQRNTLTDQIEYRHRSGETRTVQGNYLATLTCHYAVHHNLFIPETRIAAAVEYIATRNQYCPIQTYLNSVAHNDDYSEWNNLGWDLLGIKDTLATQVLQRFLIGAVARAFDPGCAMDWMPILVGEQGAGKSQFVANLVPQKLFTEMPMSLSKLQAEPYRMHVAWLLELPEVDALFKANLREEFKNLVSTRADSFRRPYDRYPSTMARKFLFLGTTNADIFLNDPTGNRRFIPLHLPTDQEVNWRQLPKIRDRLWATALRKYKEGVPYVYHSGEIKKLEGYMRQFQQEDTWMEEISEFVDGMTEISINALLKGIGTETNRQSPYDVRRAGEVLKKLGWQNNGKRTRFDGKKTRVWEAPAHQKEQIDSVEESF